MRRVTTAFACVLGGFAIGFLLSRLGHDQPVAGSEFSLVQQGRDARADTVPAAATPEAAGQMLQLLAAPATLDRDVAIANVLAAMTGKDFAAHAQELQSLLKEQPWDSGVADSILDRWFQLDPDSARNITKEMVTELNTRMQDRGLAKRYAAAAARHDPQWAVENLLSDVATKLPGWSGNAAVMEAVVKKDRKLADVTLEKYRDSSARLSVLAGYIEGLADIDPLAAMEMAVGEKTFERVNMIPNAIRGAAKVGVGMARLALAKIDDPALRQASAWEAADVICQESVSTPFELLRDEGGLDETPARDGRIANNADTIIASLVRRDPAGLAEWAMTLPEKSRPSLLGKILGQWNSVDPEEFSAWIQASHLGVGGESPSDAVAARQLAGSLGQLMAAHDLLSQGQVLEALQAAPTDAKMGSDIMRNFVSRAASGEPAQTAEWALRLSAKEIRDPLITIAVEKYAGASPTEAATWVEKLPAGSARDAAIAGAAASFAREDPKAAGEWVARITDPRAKEKAVRDLWWWYSRADENGAREWLKGLSGVRERTKKQILGL